MINTRSKPGTVLHTTADYGIFALDKCGDAILSAIDRCMLPFDYLLKRIKRLPAFIDRVAYPLECFLDKTGDGVIFTIGLPAKVFKRSPKGPKAGEEAASPEGAPVSSG